MDIHGGSFLSMVLIPRVVCCFLRWHTCAGIKVLVAVSHILSVVYVRQKVLLLSVVTSSFVCR